MNNQNTHLYVGEFRNQPIGQIRFDLIAENTYQIGFSIAKKARGRGLGIHLLRLALSEMKKKENCNFVATVKNNNIPSKMCFLKLGFHEEKSKCGSHCNYAL